jgi:hypothetical protein
MSRLAPRTQRARALALRALWPGRRGGDDTDARRDTARNMVGSATVARETHAGLRSTRR